MSRSQAGGRMPDSKAVFAKLGTSQQDAALDELDKVNQKWGYYGAPPWPGTCSPTTTTTRNPR